MVFLKVRAPHGSPHAQIQAVPSCSSSQGSGAVRFDASGTVVVAGTRQVSKQNARMRLASHPLILFPSPP